MGEQIGDIAALTVAHNGIAQNGIAQNGVTQNANEVRS